MDILDIKDFKTVSDIYHPYTTALRNAHTPIVIDNGKQTFTVD